MKNVPAEGEKETSGHSCICLCCRQQKNAIFSYLKGSINPVKYVSVGKIAPGNQTFANIFTPFLICLWLSGVTHANRIADKSGDELWLTRGYCYTHSGKPEGYVCRRRIISFSASVKYVSSLARWGIILSLHDLSPTPHRFNLASKLLTNSRSLPLSHFLFWPLAEKKA